MENACKWARQRVRLRATLTDNLIITIEDDGPGIPASLRDTLTQRGVRADESVGGHGLGLSIAADVVEQYGGDIIFSRSEDFGGLCVEVRLPTASNCRD